MTTQEEPQTGIGPRDVARFPLPPGSSLDAVEAACRALCAQVIRATCAHHRERLADHDATRRFRVRDERVIYLQVAENMGMGLMHGMENKYRQHCQDLLAQLKGQLAAQLGTTASA